MVFVCAEQCGVGTTNDVYILKKPFNHYHTGKTLNPHQKYKTHNFPNIFTQRSWSKWQHKKGNISGLENANIQIIFNFESIYERNASYKNECRTQKRQITYSRLQFKLDLAKFTCDSFFVSAKRIFFFVKIDDAYSLPPLVMASIFGSIILYLWGIPCVQ